MGLFGFFSGRTPEEIEQRGDECFNRGEFGPAKLEYEKALYRAEKKGQEKAALITRLRKKIGKTKEGLARFHKLTGENLVQSGSLDDADELFRLALELTGDDQLRQEIHGNLNQVEALRREGIRENLGGPYPESEGDGPKSLDEGIPEPVAGGGVEEDQDDDEYFSVLCSTLPEDIQSAYEGYGPAFKAGFVALNRGAFDVAVKKLSEAMARNPLPDSLIPLELATALVNLGENQRAREIVEGFVRQNPAVLKGYQVLCDIYWDARDYVAALELFDACPDEAAQTLPMQLLLGETLYQSGRYDEAEQIFSDCEACFGENEMISRALAKTFEAKGDIGRARTLYAKIMSGCATCGARTDPFIKRRYAELSYKAGEKPAQLLELYLSLVREDPDNRDASYRRIIELYESMGNDQEAARYRVMLEQLG